jgi:hypothetical protein
MTTEIISTAEAKQTAAPLLDGGPGLISTAVLVLIGVIVLILIVS